MTTIETTEDIIKVLREQPDVREEIRRLILTDELLRLPAQFAEMRQDQAEMRHEIQRISQTQMEMQQSQAEMLQTQAGMQQEQTGMRHEIQRISQTQIQMQNDIAELKGLSAFAPTERRYGIIALELGLEPEDLLTPLEIARLSMNDAARDIDQSALQSFRDSDLIINARHSDGQLCYIAVEVSYTVDHSDIDRAIAHAEIITQLTGAPAFPVVSGVRAAAVAEARLDSDAIHWHQLPRKALDPR